jgi:hypothetical protein
MARRRPADLAGLRQRDPRIFGARPVEEKRPAEHPRLRSVWPASVGGVVPLDACIIAGFTFTSS